jgi:hypothetical protein
MDICSSIEKDHQIESVQKLLQTIENNYSIGKIVNFRLFSAGFSQKFNFFPSDLFLKKRRI